MTDAAQVPAAVRYKEISATAETAAQRLREHEAAKATRLGEEVTEARQRVEEADADRDKVAKEIDRLWSMAMSALWDERWMRVPPMPESDISVPASPPAKAIKAAEAAYRELHGSLEKAGWSASALLPRSRRSR